MSYPVTQSAALASETSLDVAFRPTTAGLVNVTLVGLGVPPVQPTSAPAVAVPYTIRLRLELFKPGVPTAVASADVIQRVNPGGNNRVIRFLNVAAAAADLTGDWLARVTKLW